MDFDRPIYYARDGQPLDQEAGLSLFSEDAWRDRYVDRTRIAGTATEVSTVLLVIDHAWPGFAGEPRNTPPIIFETMIFPECHYQRRYSTLAQARAGHRETVVEIEQWMRGYPRWLTGDTIAW